MSATSTPGSASASARRSHGFGLGMRSGLSPGSAASTPTGMRQPRFGFRSPATKTTSLDPSEKNTVDQEARPSLNQKQAKIGMRVMCVDGTKHGTLLFVGQTSFKEGIWAGIELDEAEPNRHDGMVKGQRYFACRPGRGVFLPLSKVTAEVPTSSHPTPSKKSTVSQSSGRDANGDGSSSSSSSHLAVSGSESNASPAASTQRQGGKLAGTPSSLTSPDTASGSSSRSATKSSLARSHPRPSDPSPSRSRVSGAEAAIAAQKRKKSHAAVSEEAGSADAATDLQAGADPQADSESISAETLPTLADIEGAPSSEPDVSIPQQGEGSVEPSESVEHKPATENEELRSDDPADPPSSDVERQELKRPSDSGEEPTYDIKAEVKRGQQANLQAEIKALHEALDVARQELAKAEKERDNLRETNTLLNDEHAVQQEMMRAEHDVQLNKAKEEKAELLKQLEESRTELASVRQELASQLDIHRKTVEATERKIQEAVQQQREFFQPLLSQLTGTGEPVDSDRITQLVERAVGDFEQRVAVCEDAVDIWFAQLRGPSAEHTSSTPLNQSLANGSMDAHDDDDECF